MRAVCGEFPTLPIPVFTHPDCLGHDPGPGHPESSARLTAVIGRLEREPDVALRPARAATDAEIAAVHSATYIDHLRATASRGGGTLDPDTVMSAGSWTAALHSAGGAVAAVDQVMQDGGNAFAAGRPPGHHALADRAMGFCLLANAAIAARHAQHHGRARILIVDWDVHHGNGTQALIEMDPSIRFVSLHEWPSWPGTGAASERGTGNVFNIPEAAGRPPEYYVSAIWAGIEAATRSWMPDLILISAGFDAMLGDPLGGFTLEPEHYARLTLRLREHMPDIPLVGLLEGGYIPSRLAAGVAAHVLALS